MLHGLFRIIYDTVYKAKRKAIFAYSAQFGGIIHGHNVTAGAGYFENYRLFSATLFVFGQPPHSPVCRNPKSLRGAQLVDLGFQ